MSGIGVILNPNSKRYRNNPEKMKRIGFIVGDKGTFAPTNNVHDVHRVAQEFKERDIDILALSGGDGTNHRTLTTFIEVYGEKPLPKIAFLKGGTVNTIAFACGVFGSPEKILANLLYKYHEDEAFETREVDIMKINGHYGFIWGCGLTYKFMEAYYNGGTPSPMQAAKTLVKAIGSALINGRFACKMFERLDAEIHVNGKTWPFKNYSQIYAGSIEYLGLGFRVFYLAREPRKLHVSGFSLPPRRILACLPYLFLGRPSGCPDLLEDATEEVCVKLSEPVPYTIDGDMHPPTDRFDIRMGPKLTVIVR